MNDIYLQAIGLCAPGLPNWHSGQQVLKGDIPYVAQALPQYKLPLLQANERRRLPPAAKLALVAALEATHDIDVTHLATIFSSSDGDMGIIDQLCTALTLPQRPVSPTAFHNSVHNAAAGYWCIGTQARTTSSSISAADASFSAGLLEAIVFVVTENAPVLLVAYDYPAPAPLDVVRPFSAPFAVAFVLTAQADKSTIARFHLQFDTGTVATSMADPHLETLRLGNPAARCLPLLQTIAQGNTQVLSLPYLTPQSLTLHISYAD